MTTTFTVSKDSNRKMKCSPSKPCYCYGKICLVSNTKSCSEGNVFLDGRPVCGAEYGWDKRIGRAICQELGFKDIETTTKSGA